MNQKTFHNLGICINKLYIIKSAYFNGFRKQRCCLMSSILLCYKYKCHVSNLRLYFRHLFIYTQ